MKAFLQAFRSGHPGSLVAALLYFDVSFMVWVLVGTLGVFIAGDLRLSAVQKGIMVAVPPLGGAFFRIVVGILADRYGPKKVGLFTLTAVATPLLWGWWGATTFREIIAVGLLLGIAGASFAVAIPLASRSYPREHQGFVVGVAGAGNSGTVLAALFGPLLAVRFGWHQVFGFALIPVVLVGMLFYLLARETPCDTTGAAFYQRLKSVWRPELLHFCIFYSITFGGFVGLAGFLGILLHEEYGVSAVLAGILTAACVFVGSFFRPVGGTWADRLGGANILLWLLLIVEASFVAMTFTSSLWLGVALMVVGMSALGAGNGAVFQMIPLRFREEIGVVSGIVGAAGGVGGFLFPILLGILKQKTGSYHGGLFAFVVAAQMSLFLVNRYRSLAPVKRALTSLGVESEPKADAWEGSRDVMDAAEAES